MLAVGCAGCLKRTAERNGDTVVFVPLKNVLVMILSLSGMVLGGMFFLNLTGSRVGYYIGFAVGFTLLYFIAQMVAEKSFHIFHKARKLVWFGGIAAGMYAAVLVFSYGFMWGYVSYAPKADDVLGVHIWHGTPGSWWREGERFVYIQDRDIIERAITAHDRIIAERRGLRNHLWYNVAGRRPFMTSERFPITYQLKNGRYVTRMYRLPNDFMRTAGLEALIREEAVILSAYPELLGRFTVTQIRIHLHEQHVLSYSSARDSEREENTFTITQPGQIQSLLEALRRDTVIHSIRQRQMQTREMPWVNSSMSVHLTIRTGGGTDNPWRTINLNYIEHIRAWLIEHSIL
jgi:hypothetical protein